MIFQPEIITRLRKRMSYRSALMVLFMLRKISTASAEDLFRIIQKHFLLILIEEQSNFPTGENTLLITKKIL